MHWPDGGAWHTGTCGPESRQAFPQDTDVSTRSDLVATRKGLGHAQASSAGVHEDLDRFLRRDGVYYDEGGHPMRGSTSVRDPTFPDRVVAETRKLLERISGRMAGEVM